MFSYWSNLSFSDPMIFVPFSEQTCSCHFVKLLALQGRICYHSVVTNDSLAVVKQRVLSEKSNCIGA